MWECGLKRDISTTDNIAQLSLLMWECGLKQLWIELVESRFIVTPYVGVWIETSISFILLQI